MTKFQTKYVELHRAVSRLVARMDEVHTSEEHKSLYTVAAAHNCPYTGPNYAKELSTVKKLVEEPGRAKKRRREGG